jgi:hypothetical protein
MMREASILRDASILREVARRVTTLPLTPGEWFWPYRTAGLASRGAQIAPLPPPLLRFLAAHLLTGMGVLPGRSKADQTIA